MQVMQPTFTVFLSFPSTQQGSSNKISQFSVRCDKRSQQIIVQSEHFPAKWNPVRSELAKVDTGFAPEFAPKLIKNAFSSREPASTSLENAPQENALIQ